MTVRVAFLGGLAGTGIGRNCMAIEDGGELIVIDCGLHFPRVRMDGVEIAIPDLSYLIENQRRVRAIFLTHGHEDHIGALQYLAPHVDCPIYGSELTLALARRRLDEAGIDDGLLRPVADGTVVTAGNMQVEFIPVAHSVPMSNALAIRTTAGLILHSGDLKLDPDPLDGRRTDLRRFRQLAADPGVRLLMLDSTNAEEPGTTESERAVHPALSGAFTDAAGRRVIATCFASHLHRVAQLIDVARAHQRVIVPVGRSMERTFAIGREFGILQLADTDLASVRDLQDLPAGSTCVICTGSQGEPRAALSLMSERRHRFVDLSASDMVIMSSDAIPGNEPDVDRMIDNLTRTGADVVHAGFAKVHVSGHAKRDELREVIERVRPQALIPIHGEYRHLTHLAALGRAAATPPDQVLMCQDGDIIEIGPDAIRVAGTCPSRYIYVSAGSVGGVDDETIARREQLLNAGVLSLVLVPGHDCERVAEVVTVRQYGWLGDQRFREAQPEIADFLTEGTFSPADGEPSAAALERAVTRQLGRFLRKRFASEPRLLVTVLSGDPDGAGAGRPAG